MKTNWTLLVKYKIPFFDDTERLSDKVKALVQAHLNYCVEVGHEAPTEGRIQIPNKGIIEFKVDDFYDKLSGNGE